ncbi:MAG: RNA 2',3'-cyclic phosphodiesterase [Rhodobacteraceae bacterium]|nr:RNA 2',3'-cyclic phosphodiesterase [Paracoccaceae bacterium]
MRIFLAIPLPGHIIAALESLQVRLPAGRPVPADNLHLTLAFLDDQPQAMAADLHEALAVLSHARFDLTLGGLDTFGGKHPKLLLARVLPSDPLSRLRKDVCKAARIAGIPLRRETFRPHVTLARFNRHTSPRDMHRLGEFLAANAGFSLPAFQVESFCLYCSTLQPTGARHEVLADYPMH